LYIEGIFVGPKIGEVMRDCVSDETTSEVESGACRSFKVVATNFQGHIKTVYDESLPTGYEVTECKNVITNSFFWSYISIFSQQTWALLVISMGNAFINKYPEWISDTRARCPQRVG
jgi:hypothetical protein